jgi:proteic killer suppression protein
MIQSFKDKETEALFHRNFVRGLPHDIQEVAFRKLRMIHRAVGLQDLRVPPANHLDALKGERKGQFSIRVNDQWRVYFEWRDGDAYKVEIADYH